MSFATQYTRRNAIQVGGLGMMGLNLPTIARAALNQTIKPRVKSIIFLYQFGGPSHVDTFDMKDEAPDGIRSKFASIPTRVPGLRICEHLPKMSQMMDQVTLVRTVHHTMRNHNSAAYSALTGYAPPVDDIRLRDSLELFPSYGSVVDKLSPSNSSMPSFVAYPYVIRDGAITPGQHASFLGKTHDPLLITQDPNQPDFRLPELSLPAGLSLERLNQRRQLQEIINRQARELDRSSSAAGLSAYYEKTLSMLNSTQVRQAFDITEESETTRDRYGRTTYGQSCLLARRLVEAGVKFVNVYFSPNIGGQSKTSGGWDTHGFNNTRMYPILEALHLPLTDQTLPVLIQDLKERGLYDQTMIVWMGEFGRTPRLNSNISRDHWPLCYTVLLASGALKGGYVHGRSDRTGAYPDRDGVPLQDLAATMFYALGIDPSTEIHDALDRPLPASPGQPVKDLFV